MSNKNIEDSIIYLKKFSDIYNEFIEYITIGIIDENNCIKVNGYDVNKLLDAKIPEGDYDTISGYLQEELGRIPEDEEKPIIETKTVTYKIEQYEDKRIIAIKACKNNNEIIEETKE